MPTTTFPLTIAQHIVTTHVANPLAHCKVLLAGRNALEESDSLGFTTYTFHDHSELTFADGNTTPISLSITYDFNDVDAPQPNTWTAPILFPPNNAR